MSIEAQAKPPKFRTPKVGGVLQLIETATKKTVYVVAKHIVYFQATTDAAGVVTTELVLCNGFKLTVDGLVVGNVDDD